MPKKPTYNDLMQGTSAELKKTYKLTDRQLETAVRYHSNDIKPSDAAGRREFYESVYSSKRKS